MLINNAVNQIEFKEIEEQFIRESDITIIDKQKEKPLSMMVIVMRQQL